MGTTSASPSWLMTARPAEKSAIGAMVRAVRCKSRKLRCDVDPLDRLGRRALPGLPEMDQPVGLHVWQRPQQNPVDHAENRRRRANAKRERQHGHRSERAVTAQRAQRHFDVLNQAVHVAPARQRPCPCMRLRELRATAARRSRTTRGATTGSPTVGRRSPSADNLCPLPCLPRERVIPGGAGDCRAKHGLRGAKPRRAAVNPYAVIMRLWVGGPRAARRNGSRRRRASRTVTPSRCCPARRACRSIPRAR